MLKGRGGGTYFFFKVKPKIKTALLRESSPVVLCHTPPVSMRLMSVNHSATGVVCVPSLSITQNLCFRRSSFKLFQPRPLRTVLGVGYKRFFWVCYKRKKWVTI